MVHPQQLMRRLLLLTACGLTLVAPLQAAQAQDVRPTDLRVEHLRAPLGLDAERPRLSWRLDGDTRGARQSAYQIRVAASPDELATGPLWDSGRVDSGAQHLVPYAGPDLAPGARYAWAVRAWDGAGEPSGWVTSTWTAGRLGDWGAARWIGLDSLLAERVGLGMTGTPRLRKAFQIDKPVVRATIHVTGLGHFELSANGARVGDDLLAPGWTDPAKTVLYRSYDVTDRLQEGENALGIGLGGGHYRIPQGGPHAEGRYAKFWDTIGPFQAIAHLTVEHPDGAETVVVTDGSWQVGASPTVFSSIWGGEDYDARRRQPGWDAPGFAAPDSGPPSASSSWAPAMELPGPGGALVAQTNPPITAHKTFTPQTVTEPAPGVLVIDLGHNHSGIPRLRVRGEAGQTLTLRPSEVLGDDGTVDPTSLKHWGHITFGVTLGDGQAAPGDELAWAPRYTYTGYRYLQLEGAALTVEDAAARGVPHVVSIESDWIHADAPVAGTFETSNDLINGIHGMIHGAIRSNMMSVMTDCPHREKLGWLEEAYLMGPSVLFNYDVGPLYAKWTDDMAEAQEADGLVTTTAPEYTFFGGNFRDSPEWGSAIVHVPALVWTWTGDDASIREHYGAMARYVDYLDGRKNEAGLVTHGLGDWYDIGPNFPGESQLTSKGVTATATQASNLALMADFADRLGRADDARRYRARRFATFGAFNRAFWKPDVRHYDTGSQTAQAMPLTLGLVPSARQPEALATLVADVVGRGTHPTAGDVGHRYLVQALHHAGRSDLLYGLATQTGVPSYGAQLLAGATTLTEAWDANPVQSQNHFMLGHLEEWFWSGLGGLSPDAPGWQRFTVRPEIVGDLTRVRATHRSPYGEIESAWTRSGDTVELAVAVPVGSVATVYVPAASPEAVRESGRPAASAPGLRFVRQLDGRAVYELAPGRYTFTSTLP